MRDERISNVIQDDAASDFRELADILAPGKCGLPVLLSAYFDESIYGKLLCVAGYVFTKTKCDHFNRSWGRLLKRHNLPYFRMSSCAHGNKPFNKLSLRQRIEVETAAIDLIKKYASVGFSITLDTTEFKNFLVNNTHIQTPYELGVRWCLIAVRVWMDEHDRHGPAAYIFEAGHQHQKNANSTMEKIFLFLKDEYKYASHSFIDKRSAYPCQAADILAWHWLKERRRIDQGYPVNPRKDLLALIGGGQRYFTIHGNKEVYDLMSTKIVEIYKKYGIE